MTQHQQRTPLAITRHEAGQSPSVDSTSHACWCCILQLATDAPAVRKHVLLLRPYTHNVAIINNRKQECLQLPTLLSDMQRFAAEHTRANTVAPRKHSKTASTQQAAYCSQNTVGSLSNNSSASCCSCLLCIQTCWPSVCLHCADLWARSRCNTLLQAAAQSSCCRTPHTATFRKPTSCWIRCAQLLLLQHCLRQNVQSTSIANPSIAIHHQIGCPIHP
jgi:hypothetical protein